MKRARQRDRTKSMTSVWWTRICIAAALSATLTLVTCATAQENQPQSQAPGQAQSPPQPQAPQSPPQAQTPPTPGQAQSSQAPAQAQAAQQGQPTFKKEEVEQLVAPIALYPDALVAQILMASTYPVEIVSAARWSKANPKVTGKAL